MELPGAALARSAAAVPKCLLNIHSQHIDVVIVTAAYL